MKTNIARSLVVLALCAPLACGKEDGPTQPNTPAPPSWKAMASGTSRNLRAVWGSSASNIYAVGDSGTVLHYDGANWTLAATLTDKRLTDVWGTSPSDFYITSSNDTIYHYNGVSWEVAYLQPGGNYFTSVWGSSASDVYVSTLHGALAHFDGADWEWVEPETDNFAHTKLWGTASANVYATHWGYAYRFTGSTWDYAAAAPTYTRADVQDPLGGIGGSGAGNVFVVGGETVRHYNGTSWSTMSTPDLGFTAGQSLFDVWAGSTSDVWVVGDGGTLLHYDGTVWTLGTAGAAPSLKGIWGTSGSNLYAVGKSGVILHYSP